MNAALYIAPRWRDGATRSYALLRAPRAGQNAARRVIARELGVNVPRDSVLRSKNLSPRRPRTNLREGDISHR